MMCNTSYRLDNCMTCYCSHSRCGFDRYSSHLTHFESKPRLDILRVWPYIGRVTGVPLGQPRGRAITARATRTLVSVSHDTTYYQIDTKQTSQNNQHTFRTGRRTGAREPGWLTRIRRPLLRVPGVIHLVHKGAVPVPSRRSTMVAAIVKTLQKRTTTRQHQHV